MECLSMEFILFYLFQWNFYLCPKTYSQVNITFNDKKIINSGGRSNINLQSAAEQREY